MGFLRRISDREKCNALGPISLANLLKRFQSEDMQKLKFPYTFCQQLDDLNKNWEDYGIELFRDPETDKLTLGENYRHYTKMLMEEPGCSERAALNRLQLKEVPPTAEAEYEFIAEMWRKSGHKTLWDICHEYLRNDTVPLVQVIDAYNKTCFDEYDGLQPIKTMVSNSQLAMQVALRSKDPDKSIYLPIARWAKRLRRNGIIGSSSYILCGNNFLTLKSN